MKERTETLSATDIEALQKQQKKSVKMFIILVLLMIPLGYLLLLSNGRSFTVGFVTIMVLLVGLLVIKGNQRVKSEIAANQKTITIGTITRRKRSGFNNFEVYMTIDNNLNVTVPSWLCKGIKEGQMVEIAKTSSKGIVISIKSI